MNADTEFGMMPQNKEMEEMVLGAIMLESDCLHHLMPLLHEDIFYAHGHAYIFMAIKKLWDNGNPVDIMTVTEELRKMGYLDTIGGAYYISCMTSKISSGSNSEFHTRLITQLMLKRKQIRIGNDLLRKAYDMTEDVFDTQKELENETSDLNKYIIGHEYEGDTGGDATRALEIITNPNIKKGITTGNAKIDRLTGGWQKKDLVILGARPSVGKTTKALEYAMIAAENNEPVAFFSMEMGKHPINWKLINRVSGVSSDRMREGNFTPEELIKMENAVKRISKLPLYINDNSGINVNYARTICRERKRKYGLSIVIFDYIQLMTPNVSFRGQSRENIISEISTGLKKLAKDLDITVIALSQLNRDLENRPDKRPMQSDLRESGQLEQDADVIMMLYRPSKYYLMDKDKDYNEKGYSDDQYRMIVENLVVKQRMGNAGVHAIEYFDTKHSTFLQELTGRLEIDSDMPF